MMSFCKKSVHSFLGFSSSGDCLRQESPRRDTTTPSGGLGLIAVPGEIKRAANVVESAAVKPKATLSQSANGEGKRDPGGIGFLDDVGGGVDGLMLCTESLGFESCDERRIDDQFEGCDGSSRNRSTDDLWKSRRVSTKVNRETKKFPPLLSSLNQNGQPSFFLRPVRKDGRLELVEIRIERPEILRASRQDGRLRLHLIVYEEEEGEEEEEEEEAKEEEGEEEVKQEESAGDWRLPTNGEDTMRRCHELASRQHNSHDQFGVWSQHCVTSR